MTAVNFTGGLRGQHKTQSRNMCDDCSQLYWVSVDNTRQYRNMCDDCSQLYWVSVDNTRHSLEICVMTGVNFTGSQWTTQDTVSKYV
ncbi:hypothetical protein ElyMa_005077200 [Elysia marginata]|uniref:Uncharacterized protein n=1 Tax=Elysia marginata TaxID=1093978 RepID=A0AAV4JFQ6_9GAST|nr:hypothetical protein ElyMa_005077200 [Elysia marginata]